jgi:hypothetical protein
MSHTSRAEVGSPIETPVTVVELVIPVQVLNLIVRAGAFHLTWSDLP